jgi:chorismate mutase
LNVLEERRATLAFIYFNSFLLVNSPIGGAVAVSRNFSKASIPEGPGKTSCSPSFGLCTTTLGTCTFSTWARLLSVTRPNVNLSWFLDASSVNADLNAVCSSGMYAMTTASSTDLKCVMFLESRVEIVGRVARLTKDTILSPKRIRNVLEEQIGKFYLR